RFLIPQKLYGREPERAALRAAFARVSDTGVPELVLVSGYSGIGKSTVIRELMQPVVERHGCYLSGKFEQNKQAIPYFPIARAFGELVLDIVAEGETQIDRWRERLTVALGRGARCIVDVIPDMALTLGSPPPAAPVSSSAAEAGLRIASPREPGRLE